MKQAPRASRDQVAEALGLERAEHRQTLGRVAALEREIATLRADAGSDPPADLPAEMLERWRSPLAKAMRAELAFLATRAGVVRASAHDTVFEALDNYVSANAEPWSGLTRERGGKHARQPLMIQWTNEGRGAARRIAARIGRDPALDLPDEPPPTEEETAAEREEMRRMFAGLMAKAPHTCPHGNPCPPAPGEECEECAAHARAVHAHAQPETAAPLPAAPSPPPDPRADATPGGG